MKTKIKFARIHWYRGYANSPDLMVYLESEDTENLPVYKEYKINGGSLYIAECGDSLEFFAYASFNTPKFNTQDRGFGGRHFNIKLQLDSGEIINTVLKGPWSSGAYGVNSLGIPDLECVDYTFTNNPDVWRRGDIFFSGSAIKRSAIQEYIDNDLILSKNIKLIETELAGYPNIDITFIGEGEKLDNCTRRDIFKPKDANISGYGPYEIQYFKSEYERLLAYQKNPPEWLKELVTDDQIHEAKENLSLSEEINRKQVELFNFI